MNGQSPQRLAGKQTSSLNFLHRVQKELHLLLIQLRELDVFSRDPFFRERKTAFIAVMEVVDHCLSTHVKFFDTGVVHVASLVEISKLDSSFIGVHIPPGRTS